MTVIVTGAAGLLGGAVVRALRAAGRQVVATDVRAPARQEAPFALVDLQDAAAVAALAGAHEGAAIVHCGAVSGPMVVAGDPRGAFAINVGGALNVAEAARLSRARRVIVLSSVAVYGDQEDMAPVTEAAPLRARDVYGASKVAMETVLRAYRTALGAPVTVLRVASVYGPGRQTACFLRATIETALRTGEVCAPAPCEGRRQFVHVDDVVRAILAALDAPGPLDFAYNVGGGVWLTEREVADACGLRAAGNDDAGLWTARRRDGRSHGSARRVGGVARFRLSPRSRARRRHSGLRQTSHGMMSPPLGCSVCPT